MSQEKAQLIAPIGIMTVSGMTATGVITATSFTGNIVGSAKSLVNGTDVTAGVVTGTSFVGNLTGNIQRLADSAPNINVGVTTATSFVGNLTGSVTDLTSQPAITVGLVTATSLSGPITGNVTGDVDGDVTGNVTGTIAGNVTGNVTGNATGIAGGLGINYNGGWTGAGTSQVRAGVVTATFFHGDGSNLDGVSSGPVSQQAVTADGATTTIDLSSGNLIYMSQSANTTVSFANSENGNVYIVRTKDDTTTARTITWPDRLKWNGGTEPTLLTNETENEAQVFLLVTRDEGVTWYGDEVVNYSAYLAPPRTLFTWGSNEYGMLGQNDRTQRSSPVQIPGTTWMNVQVGDTISQNAFKTDGTMWVWGRNPYGQLGLNQPENISTSSPVQLSGSWKTFAQYLAGGVGLKNDGTLWSTGASPGTNDGIIYSSPVQIPGTNWEKISPGNNGGQKTAINTDSELYVWGNISEGNGFTGDRVTYSSPIQIPGSWASVRGGSYVITGVKTDGTLWMSGRNHGGLNGSLGQNNETQYSSPVQVPGTTWASAAGKIAGGGFGCIALKTDNTLWTWGRNASGELGMNNTTTYSSPVQIPGTNWALIEPGYVNNLAIKTDGTLWGWGDNRFGHLGLNNETYLSSPTQIPGTYPTTVLTDGFAVVSASYGTVSVLK